MCVRVSNKVQLLSRITNVETHAEAKAKQGNAEALAKQGNVEASAKLKETLRH